MHHQQQQGQRAKIDGLALEPDNINFIKTPKFHPYHVVKEPYLLSPFESACVHGPLSTVQSIIASQDLTPISIHHGLSLAINTGNIDIADYLLARGAPIARSTATLILRAPVDQQIALFDLLITHTEWTPNTRDKDGAVLLPNVVTNMPLLRWFLDHGANPNFGARADRPGLAGGPIINSAQALEAAAARGSIEAVQMLLDAGAQVANGTPLHRAAGACPPGVDWNQGIVTPTREFDKDRIPIIDLLVSRGADVNQEMDTPYVQPTYAIQFAVVAGATERVKWLLDRGANPYAKRLTMSAAEVVVTYRGTQKMKRIMKEAIRAQKWVENS